MCHGGACKVYILYMDGAFLKPSPNKPWFLRVSSASILKTLQEKEKLLATSVFYHFGELYAFLIKLEILVCKLFEFGKV